ncbi:MAG: ArnT family glycosyltransferase [Flammeovirgaceae bacterium]
MDFKRLGIVLLLVAIAIALLGWNHVFELRFEEPRRAIVTWEMLHFKDFLRPTIQGWSYYNKPPFFNLVMGVFCWLLGSFDEWVIRLPSILSLLATGFLFYRVSKPYIGQAAALGIGLLTLTSSEIFFHSTIYSGEIDLFFLFLTTSQVLAIFVFQQKGNYIALFLTSYFIAACGVLTKGLPSIAFQGITILAWLIASKSWKKLFHWSHFVGIALFVLMIGGYFYAYSFYDDAGAFAANLFKEASQRTATENSFGQVLAGIAKFPLTVAFLLLPWLFLVVYCFRKGFWNTVKNNPFLHFSVVFILANIILYWLSPGVKRRYLFMFIPFLFGIIAHFFVKFHTERTKLSNIVDGIWTFFICLISLAFLAFPFIPVTADVSGVWMWSILFFLLAVGIVYTYLKQKNRLVRLLFVVGIVVLARFGFNVIFMPGQAAKSDSMIYRGLTEEVLAITQQAEIHFGDDVINYEKNISFGPWHVGSYSLKRPPFFNYQIPYYLSKANGHVMQFDEEIQADVFYILPKAKAERLEMNVYKEFYPSKHKDRLWALAKKEQ